MNKGLVFGKENKIGKPLATLNTNTGQMQTNRIRDEKGTTTIGISKIHKLIGLEYILLNMNI